MSFYPEGDEVNTTADTLGATTDGLHILGATLGSGNISFSDIGVIMPKNANDGSASVACPDPDKNGVLQAALAHTHA